jgi:hypothetical protein
MAEELSEDILDFIDEIKITTRKEKSYLNSIDWSVLDTLSEREEEYDLQNLLVNRALSNAETLFKLAKADIRNAKVKVMLEELLSLFKIHDKRSNTYLKTQDWTAVIEGVDGVKINKKKEIEFQSAIQKNSVDFRSKSRKININEEGQTIDIPIFSNIPIPLLMIDQIQERYPEVKEMLEEKRKKFYGVVSKKETPKKKK